MHSVSVGDTSTDRLFLQNDDMNGRDTVDDALEDFDFEERIDVLL